MFVKTRPAMPKAPRRPMDTKAPKPTPARKAANPAKPAKPARAAKEKDPARRVPLQERSRQRVERILDAAADIFVEKGYDGATTEEIADRAGTSIGSLYQFFPNKLAVFDAIAARYFEQSKELYGRLVTADTFEMPWEALVDRVVDGFAELHRSSPAFRAVWFNWNISPVFLDAGQALNREFAERTEYVLAAQAKRLPARDRPRVAMMLVEVLSAMLLISARLDRERSDALLSETKVLIRRYLAPYAPPP